MLPASAGSALMGSGGTGFAATALLANQADPSFIQQG